MFAHNVNRAFSKVTVILLVVFLSMLAIGLIPPSLMVHSSVKSTPLPTIPSSCEGAELVSLQEMFGNTSDPEARQLLEAKMKVLEQEARDCANAVARHAQSTKPAPDSVRLPTSIPLPTLTPSLGIQAAYHLPTSGLSAENMWVGYADGNLIEVFAGALFDEYWQSHQDTPAQGAVYVMVNGKVLGQYLAPTQSGALRVEAICDNTQLVLRSTMGEILVFDIQSFTFLPDIPDSTSCSGESPQ
jgi:hypothetical protein